MIIKYSYNFIKYIFFFFINILKKKQFVIISPGILGKIFKKIIIFDRKKKSFFSIYVRNIYDIITVYEIFGYDNYSIQNFEINKKILEIEKKLKEENLTPLIIDCGANIGCSGVYFNKIYNKAFIVNIEPEKNNFKILEKNCRGSLFKNMCSAISSKNIFFDIDNNSEDNRSYKISEGDNEENKSVTVNQILDNYGEEYMPFLIKFDIEGFEKNVFSENIDWIKKFKIIIIEIHDWMLPGENCSQNFFNSINKIKKDILINGENIIVINYEYKI